MAFTELQNLWWERIFERDRDEFAFGDTLDVKTGLILVILIFLAGESAEFLRSSVTLPVRCLQYFSVGSLIIGGVYAVLELWPRKFLKEAEPQEYDNRRGLLTAYYSDEPDAENFALMMAIEERVEASHARISKNSANNRKKSKLLNKAFYFVILSLAANLTTLVMRLFQ